MSGKDGSWQGEIYRILPGLAGDRVGIDYPVIRNLTNTYLVRSLDGTALRFSIPVLLTAPVPESGAGGDGMAGAIIDAVKATVPHERDLGPIAGVGTEHPGHCLQNIEPVTLVASRSAIGTDLWRPDHGNRIDGEGIHLVVRGALQYPGTPTPVRIQKIEERFRALLDALDRIVRRIPERDLVAARDLSIDQKDLRRALPGMGLVAFIADGTLPARRFTRLRCHPRIAGRRRGACAVPVSAGSIRSISNSPGAEGRDGASIRRRRPSPSRAQTPRERAPPPRGHSRAGRPRRRGWRLLVSVNGVAGRMRASGDSSGRMSASSSLGSRPASGDPRAAFGQGSGSLVMAHEIQTALRIGSPLIIIDEDRAATNLLVPGCLQGDEVTPLATLLATRREVLGEATILFAASSLDILTAEADRIMQLVGHETRALDREEFRRRLDSYLAGVRERLGVG